MQQNYDGKGEREQRSYLAQCKKAYRRNHLDRNTARFIATEIHALERKLG